MIEVNHSKIKETNRKKIIALLLERNEITKLDISRQLNISITTVSTNINELKSEGIVEDVRSLESTGGRKAISIKLNENCRYSIGVALTPKHIKISLVNLKKEIIENLRFRHQNDGIENILNLINEKLDEVMIRYNITSENLLGIGISLPGTVDSEEGIVKYSYLLGLKNFNLKQKLKDLEVPIYVDNEANLSAYYEFLNKKDQLNNLLYVSITDGLGLGIIIDRKIYRGENNSSGEMGHMKIAVNGKECKCGARGCLEVYASMNALVEEYNEISSSKITDIDEFAEKYLKNDILAQSTLNKYINTLGIGISNLIMLLDPSSVILGGDINSLIKDKINNLKDIVYKDNLFTSENSCNISVTNHNESYLLGAAMIPIEEFLTIK